MSTARKRPHPADALFLAALVLVGVALTIWAFAGTAADGAYLEVQQNGALILTLPLGENTKKTITAPSGQTNTFRIENNVVTMTESNCGDHTCIQTGGISHSGETIVCLPHRLVLTVRGGAENTLPDAVTR